MNSAEFVEPYRRTIPEGDPEFRRAPELMAETRFWANAFGEVLHDALSGEPIDVDQYEGNYYEYAFEQLPAIVSDINRSDYSYKSKQKLLTEVKFHLINEHMFRMWWPLYESDDKKPNAEEHRKNTNLSQAMIAFGGLSFYLMREKRAGKRAGYSYFDSDHEYVRKFIEGMGNECDAGLVLMEAIKPFPDLTVVPGPPQFEQDGNRTKSTAADFVIVSSEGKALGAQVKTTIADQEQVEHYDKRRLMLIDASRDFGNNRVLRTQQESSHTRRVSWSGTLSAQYVQRAKLHGPSSIAPHFSDPRTLQTMQMHARMATRGMSSDFQRATQIIRERMTRQLRDAPVSRKPIIVDLATDEKVS